MSFGVVEFWSNGGTLESLETSESLKDGVLELWSWGVLE